MLEIQPGHGSMAGAGDGSDYKFADNGGGNINVCMGSGDGGGLHNSGGYSYVLVSTAGQSTRMLFAATILGKLKNHAR